MQPRQRLPQIGRNHHRVRCVGYVEQSAVDIKKKRRIPSHRRCHGLSNTIRNDYSSNLGKSMNYAGWASGLYENA
jgi:hypothetical protein